MVIKDFKYEGLMKYFEEISAIPRASYKEERIADYLCEFAKARGLSYYRDEVNNVLINAPATAGMENAPAILLQGHTDMVCEKNEGVEHDFDNDGLELYEDNGWIRARGTTLGADNGVAVAVMLYVLDGGVERHGDVQCLFTASEEVGLDGAKSFDYTKIFARRMINMDSADEELIIAGCAGGMRSTLSFDVKSEEIVAPTLVKITVKGLMGGHSGEDIDKGRANANKLMARALYAILDDKSVGARVVSVHGGSKDNAIPRECEAVVSVSDLARFECVFSGIASALKEGISSYDANISVTYAKTGENVRVNAPDAETAEKLVRFVVAVPNGIFEMNYNVKGIVEWSRNLGIVALSADEADCVFAARSSFDSRIDASGAQLDALASLLGASVRHYNRYPGWNYAEVSALREAWESACESELHTKPETLVIHAGLECGFIKQAVPDMDIISCGPVIFDLHSPDERLDKKSFERFYSVVKSVIENNK